MGHGELQEDFRSDRVKKFRFIVVACPGGIDGHERLTLNCNGSVVIRRFIRISPDISQCWCCTSS